MKGVTACNLRFPPARVCVRLDAICDSPYLLLKGFVLRVFLTKGHNLPPSPLIYGHDRFPLASQRAIVSYRVFQHKKLTDMELVRFVLDGTEVRDGHWEVGLSATSLFGLYRFNLGKLLL